MAESPDNAQVVSRLSDKWQIPLLLLATVALGAAVVLYLLSSPGFDWEKTYQTLVDDVEQVSDGDYSAVATQAREMLSERITPVEQGNRRGRLYVLLGDIRWRSIERTADPTDTQWEGLREDYSRALDYRQPKAVDAAATVAERIAAADTALGDADKAMARLGATLRTGADKLAPKRRAAILRRLIELQRSSAGGAPQPLDEFTDYIAIEGLSTKQYSWGVGQAVDMLIAADRLMDAERLIKDQQTRDLEDAKLQHLAYHRARVLAERGLSEQADNALISLCSDVPESDPLLERCRLLRAELIWQDNPSEAGALFSGILTTAAGTPIATAARVGLARAYGRMGLTDKSLEEYESALRSLAGERANPFVDLPEVRRGLAHAYRAQMTEGEPLLALRFVRAERAVLALMTTRPSRDERIDVLGRLAAAHRMVAEQADAAKRSTPDTAVDKAERYRLSQQRLDHLMEAAIALITLADLVAAVDAKTHADSLWTAADLLDQAGSRDRTIEVLEQFVANHGSDERVPEARFQLGQALQAAGRYDDAIAVYKANLQARDPSSRHIKAVEGLIPMAECHVAKGEEFFDEAEKILHGLVTGREEVTPASALYRQALFALGRVYYRQGKWRRARQRLDEGVQRDPGRIVPLDQSDPEDLRRRYIRATRSMYFIADSYRRSAREALRSSKDADAQQRTQLRNNAHDQLVRADALCKEVIQRLEALDGVLSPLDEVFRRNAYFDRGDCMYELGRYADALDRYRQAVHKFQDRPEALAGLTAMYNCYQELRQPAEARACHERAAELAKHLDTGQTDQSADAGVLDQWDRWLETIERFSPGVSQEGQS